MDNASENIFYKLIKQFSDYSYTKEVVEAVQRWLIEDVHSAEKVASLNELWELANVEADMSVYVSLDNVKAKIGHRTFAPVRAGRMPLSGYLLRIAAALLPVAVVAGVYLYMSEPAPVMVAVAPTPEMIEVTAPYGESRQVLLPDSTEVVVNSGSTMQYSRKFTEDDKRLVDLSGEAYFKVKKDTGKPFVVKTTDLQVQVLGTEFNIEAYPNEINTEIELVEGAIEVDIDGQKYFLDPHEKLVFNKLSKTTKVGLPDDKDDQEDEPRRLVFDDASLQEIMDTIEKTFHVSVSAEKPIDTEERYTVKFTKNESLEEILYILNRLINSNRLARDE